nr:hypothetical protein [Tanacetum cinerariifolium]
MKANDDKMNNLETEFDHFQKQCEQMQDDLLNQMRNFIQNFQSGPPGEDKEHEATTDTELFSTKDIQPLTVQEPPQNYDMHPIIEECCVEAGEEQKQKMEDTMLDLVKICHHKQFLCIHDDVDDLMESALDSKLLSINSINSQRLDKKEQEVKIVKEQPAEQSNEVTESNAENLLPIPSECDVTLEDKKECDELVCDNHSDTFSDSKIDDDISVYDDNFEDIEYVDASIPDPTILFSITRLISNIESLKDNSTFDRVLNSFESDNSLLDNFSPEFKTFCDHSEETRSGNTTHANYSLLEYDSFCFEIEPDQESYLMIMSISRPPSEPPDDESFFDSKPDMIAEEISDKLNEDKYFNPGREINVSTKTKDDDYFLFMFVIRFFLSYFIFPEVSSLLLSAESEDTIFDPVILNGDSPIPTRIVAGVVQSIAPTTAGQRLAMKNELKAR